MTTNGHEYYLLMEIRGRFVDIRVPYLCHLKSDKGRDLISALPLGLRLIFGNGD